MSEKFLLTLISSLKEDDLESLVRAIADTDKRIQGRSFRHGRRGQKQQGVDIYAQLQSSEYIGFQAKAYHKKKLTEAAFVSELAAAHNFDPPLIEYTVVTLEPRDATLQRLARNSTIHGKTAVYVISSDDLAEIVASSQALIRQLVSLTISADVREILLAQSGHVASGTEIAASLSESSTADPTLKKADEWLRAGAPVKALEVLSEIGSDLSAGARRIRARALYSLQKFDEVLELSILEEKVEKPDSAVLGTGALAAHELGESEKSAQLIERALSGLQPDNTVDTIGAYIRYKSRATSVTLDEIEGIAGQYVDDLNQVAIALGDAAFNRGIFAVARKWYSTAQELRPEVGATVRFNLVAAELAEILGAGNPDLKAIQSIISKLQSFSAASSAQESPSTYSAASANLGVALSVVGEYEDAASQFDRVIELGLDTEDLWIRRCLLAEHGVFPPSDPLFDKRERTTKERLVFVSALTTSGDPKKAESYLSGVLTDALSGDDLAIAWLEAARLQAIVQGFASAITEAVKRAGQGPEGLPLTAWLLQHFDKADDDQQATIRSLVKEIKPETLDEFQLQVFSEGLAHISEFETVSAWAVFIKAAAIDEMGLIRNAELASVLAFALFKLARTWEAAEIAKRVCDADPRTARWRTRLAQYQFESGDRNLALETIESALVEGLISGRLFFNFALMSVDQKRKRHARTLVGLLKPFNARDEDEFAVYLHAFSTLGLDPPEAFVLEGLRRGLVSQRNAGKVVGAGIRRRVRRQRRIEFGDAIRLRIDGVESEIFVLHRAPEPPIPGARVVDAMNSPWIEELVGRREGESACLGSGPFFNKVVDIVWARPVSDLIHLEASKQIELGDPDATGVESVPFGDGAQFLQEAEKRLADRAASISRTLAIASSAHLPSFVLATRFNTSPREFLAKHGDWIPSSGDGSDEQIEFEDRAIRSSSQIFIAASTLLLLVEIGGVEVLRCMRKKVRMTRQAALQLRDWYVVEKEALHAEGNLRLDPDGAVRYVEYSARMRAQNLAFWIEVRTTLIEWIEIVSSRELPSPQGTGQVVELLGVAEAGQFLQAVSEGAIVVSEEHAIRVLASSLGAKAASFHRLLAHAADSGTISRGLAIRLTARLIERGWRWVAFPSWMLTRVLIQNTAESWKRAKVLYSVLPEADGGRAIGLLLGVLHSVDSGQIAVTNSSRVRELILNSLPPLNRREMEAVATLYRKKFPGRAHRRSEQMIREMAARREE